MFESDKKSGLDRVKKSLYSRNDEPPAARRHGIRQRDKGEVRSTWDEPQKVEEERPQAEEEAEQEKAPHPMRKAYKILFLSTGVFFLIALLVGGFTMFGGKNFVSVDNVDILIAGPVSVAGGERLSLNASVVNKNTARIELVDLVVEYPSGTKDPVNQATDLVRERESLGDVYPGQTVQRSFDAIMFGEEGATREIKFTVEYRTAGSNAIFFKEKTYTLKLSSSPILVTVDAPQKILNGQTVSMDVTVSSNTGVLVRDLLLVLDYPFGFTVSSSNPGATYSNNIWRIGDLAPGAKRTVRVQGVFQGQDGEERTIHAHVGIQSQKNEREIATNVISREHVIELERPALGLDIALGGERGDIVVEPGRTVRVDVIWTNNGSTRITNARIEAKLSGNALDRNSVSSSDGYYDSRNNAIVWEAGRFRGLDSIAPGETGRASFTFSTVRAGSGQQLSNPVVNVQVSASGDRVDVSGVSQEVTTAVSRAAKLVSNLSITSRAVRSVGTISNTGPIPPIAEQPTTYTVIWTVTNTSNSISDARVTAVLPAYAGFTEIISPQGASVTYEPTGGRVTWRAGDIPANADIGTGAKQVMFQVVVTPNLSHIGMAPDIMGPTTIEGTDSFTGATVRNTAPALTTRTTTDPLWRSGDEIVRE